MRKTVLKIAAGFFILILTLALTACSIDKNAKLQDTSYLLDTFAMGTVITQKVYGDNAESAITEVAQKIQYLESLLTFNAPQGDVYKLNQNAGKQGAELDPETIRIIEKSIQVSELSDGAFDITVGPLVNAWGIGSERQRILTQQEIQQILPLIDYRSVTIDKNIVTLGKSGQLVDLGGIAKGYAGDVAVDIYKKHGISSAVINLGGNVVTLGNKLDGSPWRVGIRNPRPQGTDAEQNIGIVEVTDKAVVTAGDDQRYFEQNGQRYHHILDPNTGYPAQSDLMSVTLIMDSSFEADALDTAVFILGLDKGKALLQQYGGVDAVFITKDKKVFVTDGLKGSFKFQGEQYGFTYAG